MHHYHRIFNYLDNTLIETPCIVIDLAIVESKLKELQRLLPNASTYYAVKANPHPSVIKRLGFLGTNFEAASIREITTCLDAGVPPDRILYGNPIKSQESIEQAYELGVMMYTFDSVNEVEKIASHAPGADVLCRIHSSGHGAVWPLSRKFGCTPTQACEWIPYAKQCGLNPVGVSFHVGSQQTHMHSWKHDIVEVATIFKELLKKGIQLSMVDVGGGLPAVYRNFPNPPIEAITAAIKETIDSHFKDLSVELIIEPGRFLVAEAGVLETEILLTTVRGMGEYRKRWVYLDAGKYNGFTEAETTEYELITAHDGEFSEPVVLAGPTCDSLDIIYEKKTYLLPKTIRSGDKIRFLSTGAYTHSYASINFNGFPPIAIYCID